MIGVEDTAALASLHFVLCAHDINEQYWPHLERNMIFKFVAFAKGNSFEFLRGNTVTQSGLVSCHKAMAQVTGQGSAELRNMTQISLVLLTLQLLPRVDARMPMICAAQVSALSKLCECYGGLPRARCTR